MCVRVHYAATVTAPWDPQRGTIIVPTHFDSAFTLRAVRAVLAGLAVPQPDDGAVCWCGEPIAIKPAAAIPSQRPPSEVMRRGA